MIRILIVTPKGRRHGHRSKIANLEKFARIRMDPSPALGSGVAGEAIGYRCSQRLDRPLQIAELLQMDQPDI